MDDALRNGWVEYWYQPKIDLQRKELVGFETFARIRHAELGIISAGEFLTTADAESATALSEAALISALRTSQNLWEMGIFNLRLAINMQLNALLRLPVAGIVHRYGDSAAADTSLIFDITEGEVMKNVSEIQLLHDDFSRYGFSLAIDDFGRTLVSATGTSLDRQLVRFFDTLQQLKGKFSEMKLDHSIVAGCGSNPRKRAICSQIITLAHSLGAKAVAVRVEKREDLETLTTLGCDIGQGFVLGEPMSEEMFLMMLWKRSVRRDGHSIDVFERLHAP